jgi:hypothetical protein
MAFEYMPVSGGWDKIAWKSLGGIKVPWAMIAAHNKQAKLNHCGQDLEHLAKRGGLSACEALAILDDRPWQPMDAIKALRELEERVEQYHTKHL